jgi:hypothetical protein
VSRHEHALPDVLTVFVLPAEKGGADASLRLEEKVGPLGAYPVRHGISDGKRIVVEQGFEMGRPSPLYVRVGGAPDAITSVHVGARAVATGGGWIDA